MVDEEITRVESGTKSALDVTLEGEIVITMWHGDRQIAGANVSSLSLHRADGQTQAWFLPAAEVERTANVAGLGPPSTPPIHWGGLRAQRLGALSMLILVALLVLVLLVSVLGVRPDGKRNRP